MGTAIPMPTHAMTHPEVVLTPETVALIEELGLLDVSSRNDTGPSFEHPRCGSTLMVGDPADSGSEWVALNGAFRYLVLREDAEGYLGNDPEEARRSLLGEV